MKNDNSFASLTHQQLWKLQFTIADGSCWEVVAVCDKRKTVVAKWISGKTSKGVLNLSGQRVDRIAITEVVELLVDF